MAYWYDESNKLNGSSQQVSFWCDSDSDISTLPTSSTEGTPQTGNDTLHKKIAKGSTCISIATSTMFVLNSNDQWVAM